MADGKHQKREQANGSKQAAKQVSKEQHKAQKLQQKTEQRVQRLIVVIGNETLPRKQIMADLELNGRRNFLARYMNPAIEAGVVKMFFPEIPSSPEQAYRLTKKGLEIWEKLTAEENK